MIKYIGLGIFSISVVIFIGAYQKRIKIRESIYSSLLEYFVFLRDTMEISPGTLVEMTHKYNYKGRILHSSGFIEGFLGAHSIENILLKQGVDSEDIEKIEALKEGFGSSYIQRELSRLDELINHLKGKCQRVSTECARAVKLSGVIGGAIVATVVFLML